MNYTPSTKNYIKGFQVLKSEENRRKPKCFPVPSFALTDSLSQVIKAFQNPVWAEQARQRLIEIKIQLH
jgi:hypothetical protein